MVQHKSDLSRNPPGTGLDLFRRVEASVVNAHKGLNYMILRKQQAGKDILSIGCQVSQGDNTTKVIFRSKRQRPGSDDSIRKSRLAAQPGMEQAFTITPPL